MKFLHQGDDQKELTYEDVFLVPSFSDVRSRMDVDLRPTDGTGMTIPLVVANMTAVAGRRMAETVTRRGGLVVLPQDMSIERVENIVRYVKSCDHVFETPVVLTENESIQTALNLINKRAHGAIVIVDDAKKPVGIFTEKDAYRRDRFLTLDRVMTREVVTVPHTMSPEAIFHLLEEKRLNMVPVVNDDGTLRGAMSRSGALRASMYSPAVNDRGELITAVAVGVNRNIEETVTHLKDLGVDIIVMDTAHGHQGRMLEAIKRARAVLGETYPLAAGNIVTAQAARDFIDAGASILKVGVGPGAMCTTRMATGVGRPQFSAVKEVADVARRRGAFVWADGGIRHPRDVALALAAGAHAAFFGSWWAGTFESPADVKKDENGLLYKENFGMASTRAVHERNEKTQVFERARRELFEEGISTSRMYIKPGEESAEDIIDKIAAGLRSACTYSGARSIESFYEKATVGVQTSAGFAEGRPLKTSW